MRPGADIVAPRIIGGYAMIDDFTSSSEGTALIPTASPLGLAALGLLLALCGAAALRLRA